MFCRKYIKKNQLPRNMPEIKRHTAYKQQIKTILESKYVQQHNLEPNYLEINNQKIMRLNIIGMVVAKQQNTLMIDDGSSSINVIMFNQEHNIINVGDTILIIGRPREHEEKRYVVIEILKKINKKWLEHRKKELNINNITKKDNQTTKKQTKQEETKIEPIIIQETENQALKIINLIKKLDAGDGAPTQQIIKELNNKETEKQIQILINEGEIYEIKPGKLKIL